MVKNIKKTYKYLIVTTGIIILLPTLLFLSLRFPLVQTLMVQRVSRHLSERINTTISLESLEYRFFNRLQINRLLIKDKHSDTMIYAGRASAGIRILDFRRKSLTFGRIILTDPVFALITDTTGEMNLTWYLDMLRNEADTLKNKTDIRINEINIINGRFSLINRTTGNKSRIPVDFRKLHLSDINGIVEDLLVKDDTTTFRVKDLQFKESNGFLVDEMNCRSVISRNIVSFYSAAIRCDSSILSLRELKITGDPVTSFNNFTEKVRLDIHLDRSLAASTDLKYFIPPGSGIKDAVWLSGQVAGTVSELRGRNILVSYGNDTRLSCDFDLSGLPDFHNSFIYLGIKDFTTSAADIERFQTEGKPVINLPEIFHTLGKVAFNGSFTGFPSDFVAYGNITSNQGSITTDVSFRPEKMERFIIKGLIKGSNIALGDLTGNPEMLGNMSINANVDGIAYSSGSFSGNLTGTIDSIELNSYLYRNITLNGLFSEKTWDGTVKITDENINMQMLGLFDLGREMPEFNFTLNLAEANLHKLNFDKNDSTSALSMLLTANFKGTNIDNIDGEIKLLNSNLRKYGNTLDLYNFSLSTFPENNKPAISLRTDFADADLRGNYSFSGLTGFIRTSMAALMPSLFVPPEKIGNDEINDFTFSMILRNTDNLNSFFRTGLTLAENTNISGQVISDSLMKISFNSDDLSYGGLNFKNLRIESDMQVPKFDTRLNSTSLIMLGQSELKDFSTGISISPDNIDFRVDWDNREQDLNRGTFTANAKLVRNVSGKGKPVLNINIDSTGIYSNSKLWHVSQGQIIIDSSSINVSRLYINNGPDYYFVTGIVSEDPGDTLHLRANGIDISWLNAFTGGKKEDEKIDLGFSGKLDGDVMVSGLYNNPRVGGIIEVQDFSLLQSEYGNISVEAEWNNNLKVIELEASNDLKGSKMIGIKGFFEPEAGSLTLTASADKLPVDALNPLLRFFASDIKGTASGKVSLTGESGKFVLNGALFAGNTSMKIDYLQTRYTMNDSVRFDRSGIIFRNVRLTDERGNPATLNGSVKHNYFRDYSADLTINTNQTMVLNTRPKDNELFYGTAYASGVTTIRSAPGLLSFDVSARTGNNTRISIPLNTSETISDYSFVNFISHDTTLTNVKTGQDQPEEDATTGIDLNFDLEVTPDAEIQLIFDPKVGDIMRGRGTGDLNISLNPEGLFRISGDYVIDDGDYLFTLGNILNKPFSVENGGRISFNGELDNAEIDIKAIYKLKASLYEILQDDKFSERIPVECHINLSGKLFNPIVGFDIYLPMADEETRTYLRNTITTEEELSRQFLYLLVMNSFYADPSYGTTLATTTTTGTSAMAVTTTEMLSNQLSNWLSQISNDFDIGFNYLPGQKDLNDQELQVALSTQLLNDRVVINSNLGVRNLSGVSDNTDQLTGDFDIEFKPKFSNRIRFKVFNRYNNPYSGKQAPYTQGLGIFFRQEFDKFTDLFRRKEKDEMKMEEETVPEEQDQ
ncbi:MAG TPA: translocation/assembly module TamB domain-containing protein [Bacteroidales bacterium]|nr:translocation/assembly module TamB domain-containing protein [Bacteroidales bacterium]HPJ59503.1 translocation/assembly module TamB domain-containing protein [Bacteroidales bacterium]HRW85087.1 translocation/assembly module TamB domain-containing protein [Bacteroidales bacterium]